MIFGHEKITNGASSDIDQATKIARLMVVEWGMSDKLGFLSYTEGAQEVFLGHSSGTSKNISDITAQVIDEEIRSIMDKTYGRAQKILKNHRKELELLAKNLLKHETLSGDDIKKILDGKKFEKQKKDVVIARSKRSKMPTSEDVEKIDETHGSKSHSAKE